MTVPSSSLCRQRAASLHAHVLTQPPSPFLHSLSTPSLQRRRVRPLGGSGTGATQQGQGVFLGRRERRLALDRVRAAAAAAANRLNPPVELGSLSEEAEAESRRAFQRRFEQVRISYNPPVELGSLSDEAEAESRRAFQRRFEQVRVSLTT